MTMPHELARLVLIEQLYRTTNLLSGGKYHHV
jgi:23S rRNA pseudoU1915 N3-methylase RlmH